MGIGSALGSVGKAFNTGLNIGTGKGLSGIYGGVGAMLTMGAAGASIGAGLSATASNGAVDPVTGAAVGGAIGVAALPATGLAVGAIGTGMVATAKAAPAVGKFAGNLAVASAPMAGAFATRAATDIGSSIWGIGSKLIDWREGADALNKIKLTGPLSGIANGWRNGETMAQKVIGGTTGAIINGKTMLGATAFAEGMKKAWNTLETAKMGQNAGVVNMTPRTPSYSNDAGATGDLVFALNANKRG